MLGSNPLSRTSGTMDSGIEVPVSVSGARGRIAEA